METLFCFSIFYKENTSPNGSLHIMEFWQYQIPFKVWSLLIQIHRAISDSFRSLKEFQETEEYHELNENFCRLFNNYVFNGFTYSSQKGSPSIALQ